MQLVVLIALLMVIVPVAMLLLLGAAVVQSAGAVLTIPRQLYHLGRDRQTRRNHALEHATVNVLEERFGHQQIAGTAGTDGFALFGVPFSPEEVMDAAVEGWRRLSRGEHRLAIHPRCGTSMIASTFLLSVTLLGVLFFGGALNLGTVVAVFALAALMSKPVGQWLQKSVTTNPQVEGMSIDEVLPSMPPIVLVFGMLAAGRRPAQNYFVRTHQAAERIRVRIRRVGQPGSGW